MQACQARSTRGQRALRPRCLATECPQGGLRFRVPGLTHVPAMGWSRTRGGGMSSSLDPDGTLIVIIVGQCAQIPHRFHQVLRFIISYSCYASEKLTAFLSQNENLPKRQISQYRLTCYTQRGGGRELDGPLFLVLNISSLPQALQSSSPIARELFR